MSALCEFYIPRYFIITCRLKLWRRIPLHCVTKTISICAPLSLLGPPTGNNTFYIAAIYGRYHDPELQKYLKAGPVSKMKLGGGRARNSSSTSVSGGVDNSLSKSMGSAVPIFIPTVSSGKSTDHRATGKWGTDGGFEGIDGSYDEINEGYDDVTKLPSLTLSQNTTTSSFPMT